jgi:hypothetical protein
LFPRLEAHDAHSNNRYFQQDEFTTHRAYRSISGVRILFHRVISRIGDFPFFAGSPELTVADYFLWRLLRERGYRNRPHTIEDFRLAIRDQIAPLKLYILCKILTVL